MTRLEVPVFSPASARAALSRGASRLEINRAGSYPQGGLTPDESEVEPLQDSPIPLRIMIRPRGPPPDGGPDFVYSGAEFREMEGAIRRFKASGHLQEARGDGFVFGVLKGEKKKKNEGGGGGGGGGGAAALVVDAERSRDLVQLAHPFACVFHRAFDDVLSSSAVEEALNAVAGCGFDGILTSGGPGSAADNVETLSRVLRNAADLEIVVGGGVRSSNVRALRGGLRQAVAPGGSRVWFHSSCLTALSGKEGVDEEEVERIVSGLGGTVV
ncbi:hypothetical protein VM1G_07230 [Cytospora mali]|uniref:Copper homeostasis protein cutC homolog n=1 Tax=Cytospora mali TaxID=578113 RepID=A0A194W5S1_CYTMA|nr:hypothetical protein VM1G_07230 [Valsa mali]